MVIGSRQFIHISDKQIQCHQRSDTEQQNAKQLYDLQGRRANNKQKGIYIQDNKKVLVK